MKALVSTIGVSLAVVGMSLAQIPAASARPVLDSGFSQPFAGPARYAVYAPGESLRPSEVNRPLGRERADRLAAWFGFDTSKVLSKEQFAKFLAGEGVGGGGADAKKAAELTRLSVQSLTNTTGTPIYRTIDGVRRRIVLGGYGLVVSPEGLLQSPANDSEPTRQINWVLAPQALCKKEQPPADLHLPPGTCGYMGRWMRANGAKDTLAALYRSAYTRELSPGSQSQASQEPHELLPNTKNGTTVWVGMAMAPCIWIVNFLLIYALNPEAAAKMPGYWTAIPSEVSDALISAGGQVPYADYAQYFVRK